MSGRVECDRLLVDYTEKMRAAQAAEHTATVAKVDSVHAQAQHDRTWPVPFRTIRQDLRKRVAAADKTAQANEAVAKKAGQELAPMREELGGCQFTGEAKRVWSFFGGNS